MSNPTLSPPPTHCRVCSTPRRCERDGGCSLSEEPAGVKVDLDAVGQFISEYQCRVRETALRTSRDRWRAFAVGLLCAVGASGVCAIAVLLVLSS